MKKFFTIILFLSVHLITNSQSFRESNLPIVLITTDGNRDIPDEPKIAATMKIIETPDGSRNKVTYASNPQYLNYSGRIKIEIRGSSSQSLPKKPYGFTTYNDDNTTHKNVSILGMPEENDWILNSIAYDPSLIRNYLSYFLARQLGNYATRERYCEVMINGDYKGLYILMEKLKIDKNRIDIAEMDETDNDAVSVTGGYIVKADKTTGGDVVDWGMESYAGWTDYICDDPASDIITSTQKSYIKSQFTNLQKVASAQNSQITTGFPSIIDVPSFVDFMIMNELASNADGYQYSTYFHKDRKGKLRAGPVWDFDLTYGNDLFHWGLDRSHYNIWQFEGGGNTGSKFWRDLYYNGTYKCYLTRRWKEVTGENGPLRYDKICLDIDDFVSEISEASVREHTRWGTIPDHNGEIAAMKNWLRERLTWMNARLTSFSACANPVLPPLVISKINYHPQSDENTESSDYEFIEITNSGETTASLTGIYLRELGIGYQFPAGSTLGAGKKLLLAGNSAKFTAFYGLVPFGEYSRELSNKTEKIVLADAFGNVIDSVRYSDTIPWSGLADGEGYFLQLKDLQADNSLAENWMPATDIMTTSNELKTENRLLVYPNPARSEIFVDPRGTVIKSYSVTDLSGRILQTGNPDTEFTFNINISDLSPGIYLLRTNTSGKPDYIHKINKL
jgi:hypothetical protein